MPNRSANHESLGLPLRMTGAALPKPTLVNETGHETKTTTEPIANMRIRIQGKWRKLVLGHDFDEDGEPIIRGVVAPTKDDLQSLDIGMEMLVDRIGATLSTDGIGEIAAKTISGGSVLIDGEAYPVKPANQTIIARQDGLERVTFPKGPSGPATNDEVLKRYHDVWPPDRSHAG